LLLLLGGSEEDSLEWTIQPPPVGLATYFSRLLLVGSIT